MTNVDYDISTPEADDTADSQAFPGPPKADDTQHFESRSPFPAATQAFSPDVRSTQSQQRSFTNLAGVDAAATARVENMSDIEEEIVTCQSLADDNKVEMRVIRRSGGTGSDSSLVWHNDDVTALDHTQREQPEQVKPASRQKAKKTNPEGKRKRKRKQRQLVCGCDVHRCYTDLPTAELIAPLTDTVFVARNKIIGRFAERVT